MDALKMKLKKYITDRGFPVIEFTDRYDFPCSIQKSSLAFEDAIWFGVDDPQPKTFKKNEGWKDVDLEKDYNINKKDMESFSIVSRMHLTRKQVKKLLPILKYFAKHGELPIDET